MIELPTANIILKQYNHHANLTQICMNNCLVDSGTSDCLVSAAYLYNVPFVYDELGEKLFISNALQQKSEKVIHKMFHCNLKLPEYDLELVNVSFYVVEGSPLSFPAILGMSVINRLVIDFRTNRFKITNVWSNKLALQSAQERVVYANNSKILTPHLLANSEFVIGPFEEHYVGCKSVNTSDYSKNEELTFVTSNIMHVNALSGWPKFEKSRNLIKLKNFSDQPIVIEKGALLGELKSVRENSLLPDSVFNKFCNFLVKFKNLPIQEQEIHTRELVEWQNRRNKLVKEVSLSAERNSVVKSVPIEFQEQLKALLEKFDWNFSRSKNDAGLSQTFLIDLELKPGDSKEPSYSRPYPCRDPELSKALNRKIEELKEAGILERSNSPWNSPVLVVKKRSGDLRLVNNYSAGVNARLLCGHYPIAPIRVLFQQISEFISKIRHRFPGEKVLMSNFDVRNGYYNIALRESKRDITSFIASGEQIRYRRLSQGLSLAPSDFSLFMTEVFGGIGTKKGDNFTVFNYLDDYCLLGPAKHHFQALEIIFERAKSHNLVLALSKCQFLQESMEFLGFRVTNTGFEVLKPRIQTLLDLDYPKTKKEAQRFSATFNFYMRAVPRISFLFRPLHDEISEKKYVLNQKIKDSIDQLRKSIKNGISVSHLDYAEPVFLAVDSSLTGVGFALGNMSGEGSEPQNVRYSHFGSKFFDKIERQLSSRSRELIGLSHALESFKDLLPAGLSFTAYVDHMSLTKIHGKSDLGKTSYITRVRNAYGVILNFPNMVIRHLPGKSAVIGLVDGISRLVIKNSSVVHTAEFDPEVKGNFEIVSNALRIARPEISREIVEKEQKNDPYIGPILSDILESNERLICKNNITYVLVGNLVYRKTEDGSLLLMIPENQAKIFLEYIHVQTFHRGSAALNNALLRTPVFIRNRSKLISETTRECLFCQISTSGKFRDKNEENFVMRPALEPFSKISVDLLQFGTSENSWYALTFYCCFSHFVDFKILKKQNG